MSEERAKLESAQQALVEYKKQHNIITDFSRDVETITAQKLVQLNSQVVDVESRGVEAETRGRQATALLKTPDMIDSIPEIRSKKSLTGIRS